MKRDEWDDRRLCPDGACIGVLAPSGVCNVCGKRGGDEVIAARLEDGPAEAPEATTSARPAAAPRGGAGDEGGTFDDDDRELCPDGACIGVIGPDGRCKVCGTPAAG